MNVVSEGQTEQTSYYASTLLRRKNRENVESFLSSVMTDEARGMGAGGPVFLRKSARSPVSVCRVDCGADGWGPGTRSRLS